MIVGLCSPWFQAGIRPNQDRVRGAVCVLSESMKVEEKRSGQRRDTSVGEPQERTSVGEGGVSIVGERLAKHVSCQERSSGRVQSDQRWHGVDRFTDLPAVKGKGRSVKG